MIDIALFYLLAGSIVWMIAGAYGARIRGSAFLQFLKITLLWPVFVAAGIASLRR